MHWCQFQFLQYNLPVWNLISAIMTQIVQNRLAAICLENTEDSQSWMVWRRFKFFWARLMQGILIASLYSSIVDSVLQWELPWVILQLLGSVTFSWQPLVNHLWRKQIARSSHSQNSCLPLTFFPSNWIALEASFSIIHLLVDTTSDPVSLNQLLMLVGIGLHGLKIHFWSFVGKPMSSHSL